MAVCRVEKTKDYTTMSNFHLRDPNLSNKARGLLSTMLSLPEDWDYTTRGLAKICKDGVDGITAQLKELTTDMLRPRGDLWENGIFQDSVSVQDGTDLYLFQAIHQEADVVVETVDCIRAMIGEVKTAAESIAITNKAVGLTAIR